MSKDRGKETTLIIKEERARENEARKRGIIVSLSSTPCPMCFPLFPIDFFTSHIGIMRIMRGEEGRVSCVKRFSRLYCFVLLTLTTHLRHPCNQPNLFCLHRSTHRSRTYFRFLHRFLKIRTIATYTRFAEYPLCHVDLVCNASMSRAQ